MTPWQQCKGVIHVGANTGQERDMYAGYDLDVLWIEPLDAAFDELQKHIDGYQKQVAVKALVTDCDDKEYTFHIASNDGESSSVFPFSGHKDAWPDVSFVAQCSMQSVTLPTLLEREGLDASRYDTLHLDAQGAELLILMGAAPLLPTIRQIITEVWFESGYEGASLVGDLVKYLRVHGFRGRSLLVPEGCPCGSAWFDRCAQANSM